MSQKYKFFITENCLILCQNEAIGPSASSFVLSTSDEAAYTRIVRIFSSCNLTDDQTIIVDNLEKVIDRLFAEFTVIKAAGGLVENQNGDPLLIYRNEVWDLPKGKLEKSETIEEGAIREVDL